MVYLRRILITVAVTGLTACAQIAYTGASAVSVITTGKSIPEHAASELAASDCSTYNWLFEHKDYWCEQRDIGKTYNRASF